MTGVDKLHAQGMWGDGVKIAIVDSGIDYTHPALGGCFGHGCKVSYGVDLVGDKYNGDNLPLQDADPFDNCIGHGTHIAGIIAAESEEFGFTGVAPNVTLGMYRVAGCAGVITDDGLIAAFLMAFEAGADVITASIGSYPRSYDGESLLLSLSMLVFKSSCISYAGRPLGACCCQDHRSRRGVHAFGGQQRKLWPILRIGDFRRTGGDRCGFGR